MVSPAGVFPVPIAAMVVAITAVVVSTHLPAASPDTVTGDPPAPRVRCASFHRIAAGEDLDRTIRGIGRPGDAAWIAWSAPVIGGDRTMCCFDDLFVSGKWRGDCCGTCRLEKGSVSGIRWHDDGEVALEGASHFFILVRVEGGVVGAIRSVSAECGLDAGPLPFHLVTGVSPLAGIDWLATFLPRGRGEPELADEAIAAIALHDAPEADRVLERAAGPGNADDAREQAIFWIGSARGRRGFEVLQRLLREDPDGEMRGQAIFALTQSPVDGAIDLVIQTARADRDPEVRSEALFWLANEAAERAVAPLQEALENDPETEVRKKAVFALSQLPADRSVPLLIDVARTHANPAVRREAIFWLGQSEDARALDFLAALLEG